MTVTAQYMSDDLPRDGMLASARTTGGRRTFRRVEELRQTRVEVREPYDQRRIVHKLIRLPYADCEFFASFLGPGLG
jgi:hypothetical protein